MKSFKHERTYNGVAKNFKMSGWIINKYLKINLKYMY
jgi:hypothetical protein